MDIENETSSLISITKKNNKTISRIKFAIGVDSLMSVSGALAGDLDPTNGMYWAWQSGYINFKIEGNSSSCKTRKNQFFFHVGGYKKPNYSLKMITLDVLIPKSTIDITINLKDFFSKINLGKTNSIMIPGKSAMELADYYSKLFFIE